MAYRFKLNEKLDQGFHRIGTEQIDAAISSLSNSENVHTGVHEARKCIKRTRSLLRMCRAALPAKTFYEYNRKFRDIARSLSGARDAQVMVETLALLEARHGNRLDNQLTGPFRNWLAVQQRKAEQELNGATIAQACDELKSVRENFPRLKKRTKKFGVLATGLQITYKQGRSGFLKAYKSRKDTDFHEWRKGVQQHWRQMQLISRCWPEMFAARTRSASQLSQLLGEDHDLTVLGNLAEDNEHLFNATGSIDDFVNHVSSRQKELRAAAIEHGQQLYAEKPRPFRERMTVYWEAATWARRRV